MTNDDKWVKVEGRELPFLKVETDNAIFIMRPCFDVFKEDDGMIHFSIEKVDK